MRARGVAAAVAGLAGAAAAHSLDVAGALPGVHESVDVRTAMGPVVTVVWLSMAAATAWVAARTRPLLVGPASALLVAGVPELLGRHDPGAIAEPGALAGALLQWLLLLAVLALGVVATQPLEPLVVSPMAPPQWRPMVVVRSVAGPRYVGRRGRPRAPPAMSFH